MITEHDLKEAIAECEGTPRPTANTCIKLAAFYTILNYMKADEQTQQKSMFPQEKYSYDAGTMIPYSDSEFSQSVESKGIDKAFCVIDELMNTLMVVNPRLYDSVMRKLTDL